MHRETIKQNTSVRFTVHSEHSTLGDPEVERIVMARDQPRDGSPVQQVFSLSSGQEKEESDRRASFCF